MNIDQLFKMDVNELRNLNKMIVRVLNIKAENRIKDIKVGDTVKVNHNTVIGKKFKVVKINRKKMRVQELNSKKVYGVAPTYSVSFNLIEKI